MEFDELSGPVAFITFPVTTVSSIDAATDAAPFFLDLNNECGFFEIR